MTEHDVLLAAVTGVLQVGMEVQVTRSRFPNVGLTGHRGVIREVHGPVDDLIGYHVFVETQRCGRAGCACRRFAEFELKRLFFAASEVAPVD